MTPTLGSHPSSAYLQLSTSPSGLYWSVPSYVSASPIRWDGGLGWQGPSLISLWILKAWHCLPKPYSPSTFNPSPSQTGSSIFCHRDFKNGAPSPRSSPPSSPDSYQTSPTRYHLVQEAFPSPPKMDQVPPLGFHSL